MKESRLSDIPTTEYWLAIATVIPVLALALALEARALRSARHGDNPLWVRLLKVGPTAATLLSWVFIEPEALRGVRNVPVPSWLSPLAESTISASLVVLLLNPAFALLTSAVADQLAAIFTLDLRSRLSLWRLRRSTRQMRRRLIALRTRFEDVEHELAELKAEYRDAERERATFDAELGYKRQSNVRADGVRRAEARLDDLGRRIDQANEPLARHAVALDDAVSQVERNRVGRRQALAAVLRRSKD